MHTTRQCESVSCSRPPWPVACSFNNSCTGCCHKTGRELRSIGEYRQILVELLSSNVTRARMRPHAPRIYSSQSTTWPSPRMHTPCASDVIRCDVVSLSVSGNLGSGQPTACNRAGVSQVQTLREEVVESHKHLKRPSWHFSRGRHPRFAFWPADSWPLVNRKLWSCCFPANRWASPVRRRRPRVRVSWSSRYPPLFPPGKP